MRSFTDDPEVIAIGVSYLRIDGFILPIYMMLFAINSFLQALKRPIWTFWIGVPSGIRGGVFRLCLCGVVRQRGDRGVVRHCHRGGQRVDDLDGCRRSGRPPDDRRTLAPARGSRLDSRLLLA